MSTDDPTPTGVAAAMKKMIMALAERGMTRPCLVVAIGMDGSIVYGDVARGTQAKLNVLFARDVTDKIVPPINIMSIDIDGKARLHVLTADDLKTHH